MATRVGAPVPPARRHPVMLGQFHGYRSVQSAARAHYYFLDSMESSCDCLPRRLVLKPHGRGARKHTTWDTPLWLVSGWRCLGRRRLRGRGNRCRRRGRGRARHRHSLPAPVLEKFALAKHWREPGPDAATLASPKSRILAWPRLVTKRLAGFMSRWAMPSEWAASISMASDKINSVSIGFPPMRCFTVRPSRNSMAMKVCPPCSSLS